jgi:serine/threonine-protein kinase
MATVHLARAVGAGGFERLVAIKVMHPGLGDDPDFAAMFLDEARVAARIRHPNVVGTVDVQEGPEGLFLVMEYIEGPSLFAISRALVKKGRRMPVGVGLRIIIDALLGLHAAHDQTGPTGEPLQIVHRDVSPQNILVSVDGQGKITDFGVARAEARLSSTRRGEVKGKLAYMSPQQVRAEAIDRRADVYAAAVVLWELLAGERLFTGDNDGALVVSVMGGARRSPRDVDAGVPAPVDRECMRALRLDPDERHPTALAFAEALEVAAEEAGVTLATPRVLAAFIKELAAHKPLDVPPVQDDGRGSRASLSSAASLDSPSRPGIAAAPARDAVVTQVQTPSAVTSAPAPPAVAAGPAEASSQVAAGPAEANSQVAAVLSAPGVILAPARSPARILAAVGVVAVLGGAAILGSRLLGGAPDQPAPAASTTAPAASASAPAPAVPASAAAPSASASAEPASAPPRASAPASTRALPKGASPPRPPRGAKGATDWKPEGL